MAAYVLRLFISGNSPRLVEGIAELENLLNARFGGNYSLEVVDVVKDPVRAVEDQVVATPTLVRHLPSPIRRVIGSLRDKEKIIESVDIIAGNGK